MYWQVLLGLALAITTCALALPTALLRGAAQRQRALVWMRRLVLAYAAVAFVLAVLHWWPWRDWVHCLWTSTHPQIAVFAAAGAFLVRDGRERRERGPWIVLAVLLAFALLPAALIQGAPDPDAGARNLGRPIAGTLEVALFGLGGPVPPALVPENDAGVARGLGYLPREITVPVGALATAAVLWTVLCVLQVAGALLRAPRLRRGFLLFAPFAVLPPLFFAQLPFGLRVRSVWTTDPTLMHGFGPLLLVAICASALVPLASLLARRHGAPASPAAARLRTS